MTAFVLVLGGLAASATFLVVGAVVEGMIWVLGKGGKK